MSTTLSGLRIFVTAPAIDQTKDVVDGDDKKVFYSRRGNGPIYRWLYEEKLGHWRSLRMNSADLTSKDLCNASWKSLPEKLQAQLGQHYLD